MILPRDWLETGTSYPSADFGDVDVDFQSNHLVTSARPSSDFFSLSGLGIRNLDLDVDLALLDNSVSEAADIFEEAPMSLNLEDVRNADFRIFSRNHSSWSVSSDLKAPDLATNDSSTDLDSNISTEASILVAHTSNDTDNSDIPLSFEELSAATGLSVADFAAHISATAEVALRNMAPVGIAPSVSNEWDVYDPFQFQTNVNDIAPKWFTAGFVLPENSVFRNVPASWNNPCPGVNPADILPAQQSIEDSLSSPALGPPVSSPLPGNGLVDTPRNDDFHRSSLILQRDLNLEGSSFLDPAQSKETRQLSDDEHSLFQSPSSSEYSPSLPAVGLKNTMRPRISRRRITRNTPQSDLPIPQSPETPGHCDENSLIPINLGTPVFDAHRGIDMEVLKAKGERYRLRNQGREYDKRWLISFAGKLSPRGELMDEFRCYVKGCKQTNKRRDHILIHVGAHLDQRPFKCIHWYVDKNYS